MSSPQFDQACHFAVPVLVLVLGHRESEPADRSGKKEWLPPRSSPHSPPSRIVTPSQLPDAWHTSDITHISHHGHGRGPQSPVCKRTSLLNPKHHHLLNTSCAPQPRQKSRLQTPKRHPCIKHAVFENHALLISTPCSSLPAKNAPEACRVWPVSTDY